MVPTIPRNLTLLALAASVGLLASPAARAAIVLQESFNYAAVGDTLSISGQSGGTGWSAGWGANSRYESTGLTSSLVTGETGGAGYVAADSGFTRNFSTTSVPGSGATDGTTYWGAFLFSFNQGFVPANGATRFLLWSAGSAAGVGVEFTSPGAGQLRVAARANGSNSTTTSSAVAIADTHLIVFRVNWNTSSNDSMSIWLNPSDVSSEAALGSATSSISGTFTGTAGTMYLRASPGAAAPWTFDEFALGTSLADLPLTVVPEPSTYALLVGLAALGVIACRRNRRA